MRSLWVCLFLVACGSSSSKSIDAPPGGACTGAVYDPCTDNTQCMSGMCHFYMMQNFTVCTTACGATTPCPMDSTGAVPACNSMLNCKPAAPNNCMR